MAFVKNNQIEIGSVVKLEKTVDFIYGKSQYGDIVKIIDIGERGYSFIDQDGNVAIEAGFDGFIKHPVI